MKTLRFFLFASILISGFIGCDSGSGGDGNDIVYSPTIESLAGTWIYNEELTSYITYEDGTDMPFCDNTCNGRITITQTGSNSAKYNELGSNYYDYTDPDENDFTVINEEEGIFSFDNQGYLVKTQQRLRISNDGEPIDEKEWEASTNIYTEKVIIVDSVLHYGPYERLSGDLDLTGSCVLRKIYKSSAVGDEGVFYHNVTSTLEFKESKMTFKNDFDYSDDEDYHNTIGPWEYAIEGDTLIAHDDDRGKVYNYIYKISGNYLLLLGPDTTSTTGYGWIKE